MTPLTQSLNKNTEDEKINNGEKPEKQLLPIGTWVRHGNKIYQCTIHYPHGPGFSRSDGTLLGFLDAAECEIIEEPSILLRKGITTSSRVRYSQEAIVRQLVSREKFKASMGKEDPTPWDPDWIYEIMATTPDGECLLKRVGDRKKPTKKLNARWLDVVK